MLEAAEGSNPQTIEGAAQWYLEGARQGDPFSQVAIARRYEQGVGVERNLIEAYAWYKLAESFRTSGAGQSLARLRGRLRAVEVQRGETLAEERRVRWSLDRDLQFDRG